MGSFSWDDKYLIGHEAIDQQHRQLFAILNALHLAMKAGQGEAAVDAALDDLLAYAQSHFAAEESVMLAIDYPELEEHRQEHRQLSAKVVALRRNRQAGERLATFEVLGFIGDWIVEHVGAADARIGKFLRRPTPP